MGEPVRNLLIVHSSGYEDISDWDEVKRRSIGEFNAVITEGAA